MNCWRCKELFGGMTVATTISLNRDSGYADRRREYRVLLDGLEIGRIGNGERKIFEVIPGQHRLAIRIDWCATDAISFLAVQDQIAKFNCGSNLRGANLVFALYYALLARSKYLWLRPG
jgi:hypothetical protein